MRLIHIYLNRIILLAQMGAKLYKEQNFGDNRGLVERNGRDLVVKVPEDSFGRLILKFIAKPGSSTLLCFDRLELKEGQPPKKQFCSILHFNKW